MNTLELMRELHLKCAFALILALCLLASPVASAQATYFSENQKTIYRLGAQNDFYYVDFVEPFGQICLANVAYVSFDRKGLYAQLLAAKLSGRRVSRLDYSQPGGSGTQCNIELVEIID